MQGELAAGFAAAAPEPDPVAGPRLGKKDHLDGVGLEPFRLMAASHELERSEPPKGFPVDGQHPGSERLIDPKAVPPGSGRLVSPPERGLAQRADPLARLHGRKAIRSGGRTRGSRNRRGAGEPVVAGGGSPDNFRCGPRHRIGRELTGREAGPDPVPLPAHGLKDEVGRLRIHPALGDQAQVSGGASGKHGHPQHRMGRE